MQQQTEICPPATLAKQKSDEGLGPYKSSFVKGTTSTKQRLLFKSQSDDLERIRRALSCVPLSDVYLPKRVAPHGIRSQEVETKPDKVLVKSMSWPPPPDVIIPRRLSPILEDEREEIAKTIAEMTNHQQQQEEHSTTLNFANLKLEDFPL